VEVIGTPESNVLEGWRITLAI